MELDGYILASFFTDKYQQLVNFWKLNRTKKTDKNIKGTDTTFKGQDLGGCLCLFSVLTGEIVWKMDIFSPNGFQIIGNEIYLNSQDRIIVTDGSKEIIKSIHHNLFNDLHTLERTLKGLLVTSSGTDSIIEIDLLGKEVYRWCGFEAGYTKDALGHPIDTLRDDINYSEKMIPTVRQAIHLNSAILDEKENIIYSTFFHQDQVVQIDRYNQKVKTIFGNLNYPHSVKEKEGNLMVANTRSNEILEISKDGELIKKISKNFQWVRDYELIDSGVLLVASANDNTIYFLNYEDEKRYKKICFDKDLGISKIKYLRKNEAKSIFRLKF